MWKCPATSRMQNSCWVNRHASEKECKRPKVQFYNRKGRYASHVMQARTVQRSLRDLCSLPLCPSSQGPICYLHRLASVQLSSTFSQLLRRTPPTTISRLCGRLDPASKVDLPTRPGRRIQARRRK